MNLKPTETTLEIPVSIEFIKAAVRDRLNTFKLINDNTDDIHDLDFGEVIKDTEGNDVCKISLRRSVYLQGGALTETNGQAKTKL